MNEMEVTGKDDKYIITLYSDKYKASMIDMIEEARLAIGLDSKIREDLFDVKKNYLDNGNSFWLAVKNNDVIGCLGFSIIPNTNEAFLHRFYIKASLKRQGIGAKLLEAVECEMKNKGISVSKVHLGETEEIWFESYKFYPKHGYIHYEPRYMSKVL